MLWCLPEIEIVKINDALTYFENKYKTKPLILTISDKLDNDFVKELTKKVPIKVEQTQYLMKSLITIGKVIKDVDS